MYSFFFSVECRYEKIFKPASGTHGVYDAFIHLIQDTAMVTEVTEVTVVTEALVAMVAITRPTILSQVVTDHILDSEESGTNYLIHI